jgi:TonB-dependent SusC/RagA subfamily outer membrane receptor
MKLRNIIAIICAFCLLLSAYGQNTNKKSDKKITITGTVLNMDKKAVEGAVFYIDSVKTSYKSGDDGSYKIKVRPSSVKLMVRSKEYGYSESLINGQTTINFTLNGVADNQALKSGDTGEKNGQQESGYRVAKIKAKKMNTYNDIYQMIRGEVSGVVVSGKSVTIEQGHSFFGSSEPLYVVNGTIVSSIDNIDPLEVKSINILKGSSAAIYGVRGSNGVISITLKNGTEKER